MEDNMKSIDDLPGSAARATKIASQIGPLCLWLAACSSGPATTTGSHSTGTIGESSGATSGGGCRVATLAGNGSASFLDGTGGPNGTAAFNHPTGLAPDDAGNVYVADQFNNLIRKIDSAGNVTTLAGNGDAGFVDGTAGLNGSAEFNQPAGVALDRAGFLYVADSFNNRIRKLEGGQVSTLAGNGTFGGVDGDGGPKGTAEFAGPSGAAVDGAGNVYVADEFNNCIRKVTSAGEVTTIAGTIDGGAGFADGDAGIGQLNRPAAVALDAAGNLYVADSYNNRIRKVDPSGNLTTVAGNGDAGDTDGTGGPSGTAAFDTPGGVAVDAAGNLYIADSANNLLRKIDPRGNVSTLAGTPAAGFADGSGSAAQFSNPTGVAVGASGEIYLGDSNNNRVRIVSCP
jgi:sugar lactone lactonase YvrE